MEYKRLVPFFSVIIVNNDNYFYEEDISTTMEKEIEKGIIIESNIVLPDFSSEMLEESELVIEGKVKNIKTSKKINNVKELVIYRDVEIAITSTIKGTLFSNIVVRRFGGTIIDEKGENLQLLTNEPHFHVGESVKLYLDIIETDSECIWKVKDYGKWVLNFLGEYMNLELENQENHQKSKLVV